MLGKNKEYYESRNSIHTVTEIFQQPSCWKKSAAIVEKNLSKIKVFMKNFSSDTKVILAGAGTSEFVGNSLVPFIKDEVEFEIESISTTDIMTHPKKYFSKNQKTLLVSFGRSGSSPESIGAVNLANEICDDIYHLIITCNENGVLAKEAKDTENYFSIILPEETHDQSFAMTSSFSSMLLTAYLVLRPNTLEKELEQVERVASTTEVLLTEKYTVLENIINDYDFSKIVYLGSAGLKGIAQESALKMLELTAGKITTLYDSPLGFRHGPKSIVDDECLTVFFLSDDNYARKYEFDLVNEMLQEKKENKLLVVGNKTFSFDLTPDYVIEHKQESYSHDFYLNLQNIVVGQLIGMLKADLFDITCDNPCPTGEVNRVVQGVTLYNLEG
jgi:tagatose-6-phosphate ketose/aldose isomerase